MTMDIQQAASGVATTHLRRALWEASRDWARAHAVERRVRLRNGAGSPEAAGVRQLVWEAWHGYIAACVLLVGGPVADDADAPFDAA